MISFKLQWLKAAALIAAHNDIRYYLNGVLVEVLPEEARLVSTDGHRMVIFRKAVAHTLPPVRLIVPTLIIDMVKPDPKHKHDAAIAYSNATDRAALEYRGVAIQFTPIDGRYPEYGQTMNKAATPSGTIGHFNATYLADFKRCVQVAFGEDSLYSPTVWHNGDGPAAITYKGRDDFFGIVMPMRASDSFSPPKWTLPAPEEKRQPEEAMAA